MMNELAIEDRNLLWKHIAGVFAFQIVALTLAARVFLQALNPDAVAYLQIASHYSQGDLNLAISGYWSPLISWLIAPLLKTGVPALLAARIFMEFSGVVFLFGCWALFRQFNLSHRLIKLGMWLAALLSIPWSVENITPDLLMAGLVGFAFAFMLAPHWYLKPGSALLGGLVWGVAYLCKSVALPLGILTCCGIAFLWWRTARHAQWQIARSFAVGLLGIALIATPWIIILSEHYGKFTVANSASMSHSLVGPTVVRSLTVLDHGFWQPQPGRITIWEDPPLPYPAWSPLTNWNNLILQLHIIARNMAVVLIMITSVCLTFPFLAAVAIVRCVRPRHHSEKHPATWWALLPVVALGALLLPNYLLISDQRYLYCTLPLLFVATAGMLSENQVLSHSWIRRHSIAVLVICFLIPTFARSVLHLNSTRMAGQYAHTIAQKISEARLAGPVAGSGKLPGGRTGLYVAYLLHQPWLGDKPSASVADFKNSGANLIIINRGTDIARELVANEDFQNLDADLFGFGDEARQFPLQIFKMLHPAVLTSP